jgi:hypothetical protein
LLTAHRRRRPSGSTQVLDEADTLLAGGFVDDIAHVYGALPARKQVGRCTRRADVFVGGHACMCVLNCCRRC